MELTNDELIKLWAVKATIAGVILTFITAIISLFLNYKNSKKVEKYKKAYEWQKEYFAYKLNSYMTGIDSLFLSLKSVREIIEEVKIRNINVSSTQVNETLSKLKLDYNNATELLSLTHAYVDGQTLEIFIHNHKNKIRDLLERIRDNSYSSNQEIINSDIATIKESERKILEKLNELRMSMPELYFTKINN